MILDVLNWIFMLVSYGRRMLLLNCRWASLSAAINSTFNALLFCRNLSGITNAYIAATLIPLQSVLSYFSGLELACRCTYAGIAFGISAW